MATGQAQLGDGGPRWNPLIRLLTSVRFGVVLLALVFAYSAVVSALPPVRRTLELTEMQAFSHWLFVALIVLLAISLLATTLLRARWTLIHAGVLTAHFGVLLLVAGALAYFGTKVEGDVLLQSPAILVRANIAGQQTTVARLPAETGSFGLRELPHVGNRLTLEVVRTQADGLQPVAQADVRVQINDNEPRVVGLGARDDWQAIHAGLDIRLVAFPPERVFYDDEIPALYIRNREAAADVVKRIDGLPIYHDRYLPGGGVLRDTRGNEVPSPRVRPELKLLGLTIPTGWFERWRMPITVDTDGLPFSIRITGYVPFVAAMQSGRAPDGTTRFEPVLEPRGTRRADFSARSASAIRVEIMGRGDYAGWSETRWCLFSAYPDIDAQPVHVHVPGTSAVWELVYSRAPRSLNGALVGRMLSVTYFPGRRGIESYRSDFMVQDAEHDEPYEAVVSTNRTLKVGRWTLYQSGYSGQDHWSYTILGVGNRHGIWVMNAGWIVTVIGCLYAFYVKPLLQRRREGLIRPL